MFDIFCLTVKPTNPVVVDEFESNTDAPVPNPGFLKNLRDKILEIFKLMQEKFKQFGTTVANYFRQ